MGFLPVVSFLFLKRDHVTRCGVVLSVAGHLVIGVFRSGVSAGMISSHGTLKWSEYHGKG